MSKANALKHRRNETNEATEMWKEVHLDQQKARAMRKTYNLGVLALSDILMESRNDGDVMLIRDRRYPALDFYPSTNKWRVGAGYLMGDANALLAYLERRKKA